MSTALRTIAALLPIYVQVSCHFRKCHFRQMFNYLMASRSDIIPIQNYEISLCATLKGGLNLCSKENVWLLIQNIFAFVLRVLKCSISLHARRLAMDNWPCVCTHKFKDSLLTLSRSSRSSVVTSSNWWLLKRDRLRNELVNGRQTLAKCRRQCEYTKNECTNLENKRQTIDDGKSALVHMRKLHFRWAWTTRPNCHKDLIFCRYWVTFN